MKLGGNANCLEFFKSHGGMDRYPDAKSKYSSRTGQMYKDHLRLKANDDAKKYPDRIVIEGEESVKKENDFFSDWDSDMKPTTQSFVFTLPATLEKEPQKVEPTHEPRRVEPESPPLDYKPKRASLTQSATVAGSHILKPSKKGLGAKKATKILNFDDIERKAKEEEEKRAKEEEEAKKKEVTALPVPQPSKVAAPLVPSTSHRAAPIADEATLDRLGMGMAKMSFGFDPTSTPSKPLQHSSIQESGDAQQRFGKAKAISSDAYFQRGDYDANASAAAREQLRNFDGKSGFGSADYYGRDESDMVAKRNASGGYDQVVNAAQDFAAKFANQASDDIGNLKQFVSTSGSKLGDLLQDIQVSFIFLI
jgi:ADP-ribosylation factor GTPase-activating protein 2/3